ncbi:MAG: hypothetical protein KHX14_04970 [[Clostridium] spiroforme]|uniref:Uncharacterized protein n=1 Tax=Thomasclavelia spiroformis TaxID=29348 RepID=A0A943I400_9FIRM|nr:hypothetical protein [Thomasclavelia spiroformis]MBS5588157.1 hypothetical protein [Thomasclavelia spiroformis]
MQDFLVAHLNNIVLIFLLLVYIVCLNGLYSKRKLLIKFRKVFICFFIISLVGLMIGTIRNELLLYWFNDASFTIASKFELFIKLSYDFISIIIIVIIIILIKNILNYMKNNKQELIRKIAINTNLIAILIIVRTVIIPLFVKIIRILELFGLNNQTSSSNDVFLYALPYLGLQEVMIIVVTIFINIIGLNNQNRGEEDVVAK